MTKDELIRKVAVEFSADVSEVSKYFENIFETISTAFIKNKNVNIGEFGKFILRTKTDKDGIKIRNISFAPSKIFAIDVNNNFSELKPVKIRTLTEKELAEKYYEPENADEIILIESDGEIVEKETTEIKSDIYLKLSQKLKKSFYREPEEDRIELSPPEEEPRIDEDRDALEAAILAYNESIKLEKTDTEIIDKEEILQGSVFIEEAVKAEDITQPEKTLQEEPEDEYTTFTKQKEPVEKLQNIFPDSDKLLIELQNIKNSFEDENSREETDELQLALNQDVFEIEDYGLAGEKTEQIETPPEHIDEKKLEEELQKMLEEREKILAEIRRIEKSSQKKDDSDNLILSAPKEPADIQDVQSKPDENKEDDVIDSVDLKTIEESGQESAITKINEEYLKSFDLTDLELKGSDFRTESELKLSEIENPERQISDERIEDSLSTDLYTGDLKTVSDKVEDLPPITGQEEEIETFQERYDRLFKKTGEVNIPERLSDAFVDIKLSNGFIMKDKKNMPDEQNIRNYNDIFKPVESINTKSIISVKEENLESKKPEKKKSMNKILIPLLLILVIAVIIMFAAQPKQNVPTTTDANTAKNETINNEKNQSAESIKVKDVKLDEDKIVYEENGIYFKQNSLGIFIQVGTFMTEKEAMVKAFLLKESKQNSDVEKVDVGKNDIRYRVKIGPYNSLEEAKASFDALKK